MTPFDDAAERFAPLREALRAEVSAGLPGAVVLVARDEAVHVETAGVTDLVSPRPMRRDTIVRIASMTKPILAAAALMLVEEGRIALGDPVERWLTELADRRVLRALDAPLDDTVPAERPITLDDLLSLRLGLGDFMAPPDTYPLQSAMAALEVAPTSDPIGFGPDEYMARIGRLPLAAQPGHRWMYHTGYDILAVLIARVAGRPLHDHLDERILGPLGMTDTGFYVPEAKIDRLAAAYDKTADGMRLFDPARGGFYASAPRLASELVSTAGDYLIFARMLLAGGRHAGGRILSADNVRAMMKDHITAEQKAVSPFFPGFWESNGWGYGGAVVTGAGGGPGHLGAYGWSGGFGTTMLIDPDARLVTILLTQRLMRGPEDAKLIGVVQRLVYRAVGA